MSDRIAVMNLGRYEQLGDPDSLYERPRDAVRRRLPRCQQPAARRRSRARTTATRPCSSPTTRASVSPTALIDGRDRHQRRRAAREDPPARADRDRRRAGRSQPARGVVRDASYLGVEHPVPGRGARRRPAHRLRTERGARHARRAVGPRRGGPADLVTRPQLRRRESGARRLRPDVGRPRPASRARAAPRHCRQVPRVGRSSSAVPWSRSAVSRHSWPRPTLARRPGRPPRRPPSQAAGESAGASAVPGSAAPPQVATGPLNFANWDAYIDLTTVPGPDGELDTDDDEYDLPSPTLDEFAAQYGVEVNYANAEIDGQRVVHGHHHSARSKRACRPAGTSS